MFLVSISRCFTSTTAATLLLLLLVCGTTRTTTLACECMPGQPTNIITTEVLAAADAVGRFYIHSAITAPVDDGTDAEWLYYVATAYHWYKGDIGKGRLIIKTGASGAACGATLTVRAFSVLIGTVSHESVPGYAGTVSALNVGHCEPQKVTSAISKTEWATLASYLVCTNTSCDSLVKPTLDPLTCPKGTEYKDSAVCEAQDYGSCGWTVSAQCVPLPFPDVCLESHCDDLDKPTLSCPTGMVLDSPTFHCEKQTGGSCGWTGTATCTEAVVTVPPGAVCDPTACADLMKPDLGPLTCPKGTEYDETAVCQGQDNGRCGWTVSATCVKLAVVNNNTTVCETSDCAGITRPTLPDSFVCPIGYELVTSSNCVVQPGVGTCGWSVSGECEKI